MAQIRAEIKRGFLRSLYRQAKLNAQALSDALDAFQDHGFMALKSGRLLVSSSGNGHSSTFQLPTQWQQFTPDEVFSLSEELEQVYADAITTLNTNGNATPNDDQIFAVMIDDDRLADIDSVGRDYSLLRWPTRL